MQSAGGGHGPGREYPDTWNPDDRQLVDEPEPEGSAASGSGGGEPETGGEIFDLDKLDDDLDDDPAVDDDEAADLELGFDDIEPREYECGNCEEPLPYLGGDDRDGGGKECPECGERIWWSEVEA